ncbi:uncharacterized protein [Nicotiana sylvestris]|uniref:uncharacterized protein n=1 Tax=Nicotiana sylvestris TaxID=4096 RepID=UPI00388C3468
MDEEDAEKIAFITPWGVYYYKMMPFGLNNVGATYMRAMTTIFHDMIHKEIEVYVDEVIIKSKRATDHIANLRKFFDRLRRYNLKLNPAKCAFRIPAGKLLGFIVNRRGIELDPSKVKAIQELPPPRSKKDVQGEWATKNSKILSYLHHVQELRKRFTKMEFRHVPRVQNEFVDALATLSSMIQHLDKNFIDPIPVKIHNKPAYCAHVEEETNGKPWFHDTKECVDAKEVSKLLEEIHGGTCDPHMNGFILAKKLLRAGYFWMTMETDYVCYVCKCYQCQVHADMIKLSPNELNDTSSPWPFVAWSMDVIGPIEHTTSNGHRFILVAIDYFTKWVEVASYKAVTKKVIADFIKDRIVC